MAAPMPMADANSTIPMPRTMIGRRRKTTRRMNSPNAPEYPALCPRLGLSLPAERALNDPLLRRLRAPCRLNSMAEFGDFVQRSERVRPHLGAALGSAAANGYRRLSPDKEFADFSSPAAVRVPRDLARPHRRDLVVGRAADLAGARADRSASQARMRFLRAIPQRPDPARSQHAHFGGADCR